MLKRLLWWMVVALASYKRNWNAPLHRIHKTLLSFLVVELTHLPCYSLRLISSSSPCQITSLPTTFIFTFKILPRMMVLISFSYHGLVGRTILADQWKDRSIEAWSRHSFFLLFPLFPSTFLFYYSRISYFQIVLMKSYCKCFSNPKKNLKRTNRKVHQNPFYSIF